MTSGSLSFPVECSKDSSEAHCTTDILFSKMREKAEAISSAEASIFSTDGYASRLRRGVIETFSGSFGGVGGLGTDMAVTQEGKLAGSFGI
jgi:hypothetical protein